MIADQAQRPADDDDGRVEQVDRGGQHLAEVAAGLPDQLDASGPTRPRASATTSIADDASMPELAQLPGDGSAAGDGLEAAGVAAPADHRLVPRELDVPHVAGRALGAAVDPTVGDDPAADAGRDLDEQQVRFVAPVGEVLAERHDVHVVVDQHRGTQPVGEVLLDREPVPSRHDRRVHGPTEVVFDGAGQPEADAEEVVGRAAGRAEQAPTDADDAFQHGVGAAGDVQVLAVLLEDRARQVRQREPRVGRAEVGGEDDASRPG